MKNERGSALLTVILIVFVTTTIGAALSSFVMMNYKLRDLDKRIGQAEYQAEKILDIAYLSIQETISDAFTDEDVFGKAITEVNNAIGAEKPTLSDGESGTYGTMVGGVYQEDTIAVITAQTQLYCDNYINYLNNNLNDKISKYINSGDTDEDKENRLLELEIVDGSGEVTDEKVGIKIEGAVYDPNTITSTMSFTKKISVFYKVANSPLTEFGADFIIGIPSYTKAENQNYDLNKLVHITNWSTKDWGYL